MSMKIITKKEKEVEEFLKFENTSCVNEEELKQSKNIVILGNFDGVHRGHAKLLERAVKKAREKGYKTIVYTFCEYPQKKEGNRAGAYLCTV